jgi:HK97 gp10 family phage protein
MRLDLEVKGLADCEKFLRTLPDEVARKMLYGALMGGATPIMQQARENVLRNFGRSARYTYTLEEAIVRGRNRRTKLAARVDVKIRKGRQRDRMIKAGVIKPHGDDAFYGRFLEMGTSKMAAKPFLRPAADAKAGESARRFNNTLMKRMAKWCKQNGVAYRTPGGLS